MKWWSYIICCILVLFGTFFGIKLYQQATKESYVNGSIDISNQFYQETFSYASTSVAFYPTANGSTWDYSNELVKTNGFDGQLKKYKVVLNDYTLVTAEIKAGSVYATVRMDFYNTDGTIDCEGTMSIRVLFLSDSTELKLSCPNEKSANYFEQYFIANGIRLEIIEILE